jgi:hypothetical protein
LVIFVSRKSCPGGVVICKERQVVRCQVAIVTGILPACLL